MEAILELMDAVKLNDVKKVRTLIKQGVDVNMAEFQFRPLFIATFLGHTEIMQVLLENGANANAKTPENSTLLMVAAEGGHCDIVKLLLDSGVNPDAVNDMGRTALMVAKKYGHAAIVQMLKGAGAAK